MDPTLAMQLLNFGDTVGSVMMLMVMVASPFVLVAASVLAAGWMISRSVTRSQEE